MDWALIRIEGGAGLTHAHNSALPDARSQGPELDVSASQSEQSRPGNSGQFCKQGKEADSAGSVAGHTCTSQ